MGRFRKISDLNIERKIKDKTEYLKCLLVLSLQDVTFEQELRTKYDIRNKTIIDFIDSMKNENFILVKDFCSIDDILHETILKINPLSFYNSINNTGVLILTEKGKQFCKKIINECVKLQNENIIFMINEISSKTKAFKETYNKLLELEDKINYNENGIKIIEGYRYVKYPDGTLIMKETEKHKQLKLELKKGILEHKQHLLLQKQEQGLLTQKQEQHLMILGENRGDLVIFDDMDLIEEKSVYNGVYSHLNSIELDKVIEGVTKEEEKQAEKKYKEEIKQKNKYYDYNSCDIRKVLNKIPETDEEETKNKRECLGFLKSLTPCD